MRRLQKIEGLIAIIIPIVLMAISGVTDVMVSEILIIPLSYCLFTGKGLI